MNRILISLLLFTCVVSAQERRRAQLQRPAAGAYNPATDGNVVEWLKADAITANDNDAVQWVATIGQDANNATAGLRPTYHTNVKNGKPTVRFLAVTPTRLATASFGSQAQPFTIALVFRFNDSTSESAIIFSGTGGGDVRFANRTTAEWGVYANNGSDYVKFGTSDNNWHILILEINGASSKWALDGAADTTFSSSPGADPIDSLSLGDYFGGGVASSFDAGEIIVRSGAFTSGQKTAAFLYLNTRWAVY